MIDIQNPLYVMCGILCSYSQGKSRFSSPELQEALEKRGPDSVHTVRRLISPESTTSEYLHTNEQEDSNLLTFCSSVLALRGDVLVRQPLEDLYANSLLCWNGEAWRIGDDVICGNDALAVFSLFQKVTTTALNEATPTGHESLQRFVQTVRLITGPYAFIYYDALHRRIFYGRDALGRRSLVIKNNLPASLVIASVCDATEPEAWTEVEADGLYMINLSITENLCTKLSPRITHIARRTNAIESQISSSVVGCSRPPFIL